MAVAAPPSGDFASREDLSELVQRDKAQETRDSYVVMR